MHATHFLDFVSGQINRPFKGFTPAALRLIQEYGWPGNLREMKNVIERAAILSNGDEIDIVDLADIAGSSAANRPQVGSAVSLEELEMEHIRQVVANSEGIVSAPLTRPLTSMKRSLPVPGTRLSTS